MYNPIQSQLEAIFTQNDATDELSLFKFDPSGLNKSERALSSNFKLSFQFYEYFGWGAFMTLSNKYDGVFFQKQSAGFSC